MDDNEITKEGLPDNSEPRTNTRSATSSSSLTNEGLLVGQRIAKISVITLISIGIVELATGYFSGSAVATADGTDSISDAMTRDILITLRSWLTSITGKIQLKKLLNFGELNNIICLVTAAAQY